MIYSLMENGIIDDIKSLKKEFDCTMDSSTKHRVITINTNYSFLLKSDIDTVLYVTQKYNYELYFIAIIDNKIVIKLISGD